MTEPEPFIDPRPDYPHGSARGWKWGCRCPRCRGYYNERVKQTRMRLRERFQAGLIEPPVHDASTYSYWGCRCEVCKAAIRERSYKSKAARVADFAAGRDAPAVHNASTYNNWDCRCDVCRADHTDKQKRLRWRQQAGE